MVGKQLKRLRHAAGLTLDKLAFMSRVNRGTIHRIENGEVSPRVDTLELLCEALGVRLEELCKDEASSPPHEGLAEGGSRSSSICENGLPKELSDAAYGLGIRRASLSWMDHLEALLLHCQDLLMVVSPSGEILYKSPFASQLLDLHWGNYITPFWVDWIMPEDRAIFNHAFQKVLSSPTEIVEVEYRLGILNKEGAWVSTILTNQLENPLIGGIICNTRDIHQSKLMEIEAKKNESRLVAVVNAIPDVHLMAIIENNDVRFTSVLNDQEIDFHKLGLEARISGMPEDQNLAQMRMAAIIACNTGENQIYNYDLVMHNGHRAIEARFIRSGELECLVLLRDVTEQKFAIEHQIQAFKLDTLSLVARGLCDNIDNVLVDIENNLNLLEANRCNPDYLIFDIKNIKNKLEETLEITSQLREFDGKQVGIPEIIEINNFIAAILKQYDKYKPANINTNFSPILSATPLIVDANRLKKILKNFINNAIEAIDEMTDGNISINVGCEYITSAFELGTIIEFGMKLPGVYLIIEVHDNGCGISDDEIPKILNPFYTTKNGNRGLGLSAAVGFARDCHGGIKVKSSLKHGTSISLFLPYDRNQTSLEKKISTDEQLLTHKKKILYAEDDYLLRRFISEYVASQGYEIIEAIDGLDAIEKITMHHDALTLIILDLTMPQVSGIEVLRRTREQKIATPIVIATGYWENFQITFEDAQEIACIIRKPFSIHELAEVIHTILE